MKTSTPQFHGLAVDPRERFRLRFVLVPLIAFVSKFILLFSVAAHAGQLDSWHWRNAAPFANTIYSLCFGSGKFVAVGEGGVIHTSSDGLTWDDGQRPVASTLNGVFYANGQFLAVGNGGVILTSEDGHRGARPLIESHYSSLEICTR